MFVFNDTATTEIYTLSLHDALPICLDSIDPQYDCGDQTDAGKKVAGRLVVAGCDGAKVLDPAEGALDNIARLVRSEEHTAELQSRQYLVCRLLLEQKIPGTQCNREG